MSRVERAVEMLAFRPTLLFGHRIWSEVSGNIQHHWSLGKIVSIYSIALRWEGQVWCSGESWLTESPGHGFEAASPQILREGEVCLGFFLPWTPLMWKPPALGLPYTPLHWDVNGQGHTIASQRDIIVLQHVSRQVTGLIKHILAVMTVKKHLNNDQLSNLISRAWSLCCICHYSLLTWSYLV